MHIRPVTPNDRVAVLRLSRRLAEQGTPAGRDRTQIEWADAKSIATAMDQPSPQAQVLVAELGGEVVGFIHVKTALDYYTDKPIGHVSDLVVATKAQGLGLGRTLLEAAASWAKSQGYAMMQLFVLPENAGARGLYEHTGYRPEWIKYVRPLD